MQVDSVELLQKYSRHLEDTCGCRVTLLAQALLPSLSITFTRYVVSSFSPLLFIDWLRPVLPRLSLSLCLSVRLLWPVDTDLTKEYRSLPSDSQVTRICRVLLTVPASRLTKDSQQHHMLVAYLMYFFLFFFTFHASIIFSPSTTSYHLVGASANTRLALSQYLSSDISALLHGRWCSLIFILLSSHLV